MKQGLRNFSKIIFITFICFAALNTLKISANALEIKHTKIFNCVDNAVAPLDTSPEGLPYKLAVAKAFSKLKAAESTCKNKADLEKIAEASDECAKLLFDCVFYL